MNDYFCAKCGEPCEVIELQHRDVEEFWGAPCTRITLESASECCQAEVLDRSDYADEIVREAQNFLKDKPVWSFNKMREFMHHVVYLLEDM